MIKYDTIDYQIRGAERLPAAAIVDEVNEALAAGQNVVITAPPGAGKSTLLPLTILQGISIQNLSPLGGTGGVMMLEPRRLAARQIAERMASMIGEPVGKTVGYRVRLETRVSKDTRLEVLTEGILTRMLIDDPTLDGVSVVIFDEFHERSLVSDVALALVREVQQLLRPDLRIVLMSATIDAAPLCQALGARHITCEGRMYPIETFRLDPNGALDCAPTLPPSPFNVLPQCGSTHPSVSTLTAHYIREAHRQHEGDILAFLPGEAEIRQTAELLGTALGETHICPLYGQLPPKEQQLAIAPSRPGERKVVLATPIAETSLTIEGVRIVIDSGLCRKMVFDQQTGLSRLETVQISLDMADQRRGRAGRVAPGICYRLWTLATEHRMAECRIPEILEADLSPAVLDIAAWGESHPERLPWLTPPPPAHLAQASRLLSLLHALDDHNTLTQHGRRLAQLPCHPRIAQMLLLAQSPAQQSLAADIAALLDEKDPLSTTHADTHAAPADIALRLAALETVRHNGHPSKPWQRILQASEQYRRLCPPPSVFRDQVAEHPAPLLASAYPERIAHALKEGNARYRLASGDTVTLDPADDLSAHEWLAVASVNTQLGGIGRIFLASPIDKQELTPFTHPKNNLTWDSRQGGLVCRQEQRIGCLLVESKPLPSNDPTLREQIIATLCEATKKEGLSMFDFSDAVGNLQRRVATVATWHPELELPDLSTEAVLANPDEWLPLFIEGARGGNLHALTVQDLKRLDMTQALWSLLTYEQQQQVDRLAPTHIPVPTGSRIRVEYRQGAEAPILRVRLQECFGLLDTPRVDNGRRPILMELLSPGFKPVQLTQDLHSFWQGTYFEVRKELRRRYPKHAWPENPLEAEAVRGVKKSR